MHRKNFIVGVIAAGCFIANAALLPSSGNAQTDNVKTSMLALKATPFRVLGRSHFSSRDCIDERERDHLDLCP